MQNSTLFGDILNISYVDMLLSTGSVFVYLLLFGVFLFLSFFAVRKLSIKVHAIIFSLYLLLFAVAYYQQNKLLSYEIAEQEFVAITGKLNSSNKNYEKLLQLVGKEKLSSFLEHEFGYYGLIKKQYVNQYQIFRDYFYYQGQSKNISVKSKKLSISLPFSIDCKNIANLSPFYTQGTLAYSYEELFLQKIIIKCGF